MHMDDNGADLDLGSGEDATSDPFAGVPAETEPEAPVEEEAESGSLGGEGATLEDLQAEQGAEEPINGEEGDPDGDPPPLPGDEKAAEPEDLADAEAQDDPEPEPDGKSTRKSKRGDSKKSQRPYYVLSLGEGGWNLVRDAPINASNGEIALREAYAELIPADSEDEVTLLVIPVHYWKPRKVAAKQKVNRQVEIS